MTPEQFLESLEWENFENSGVQYVTLIKDYEYLYYFGRLGFSKVGEYSIIIDQLTDKVYGLTSLYKEPQEKKEEKTSV